MITIQATCPSCKSSIEFYPSASVSEVSCSVCEHILPLYINDDHLKSLVKICPVCERKDFYQQKDFNRKIGVILFVIAAIIDIFWTYGLSLAVLYFIDLFLFKKLASIVVCYKCDTIFRNVENLSQISIFDHEMHDRIVYADHHFDDQK